MRSVLTFVLSLWTVLTIFVISFVFHIWITLPSANEIRGCITTEMHQVRLCPGTDKYLPLSSISKHLQNAILVSEDASFYSHNGFDFDELKESLLKNLERKRYARGGSTITQQLAKNMFLSSEKTLLRKVKEAAITFRIEQTLKKSEILERYLNIVEFGPKLYGVRAASQHYFNKPASELSILESAFLAMLLPNPKKNSASFKNMSLTPFAKNRVLQIVHRMKKMSKITSDEYLIAAINVDSFPWDGPMVEAGDYTEFEDIEENDLPTDEEPNGEQEQEEGESFSSDYL